MTFQHHEIGAVRPVPAFARKDYLTYLASKPKLASRFVVDLAHALIEAKDAIDPDPDLEEAGDDELTGDEAEPSLGAPEIEFNDRGLPERGGHIDQRRWFDGIDRFGEDEPTLGATEMGCRVQEDWSKGYQRKPEFAECETVSEDEGADPMEDGCEVYDTIGVSGEQSLGWCENVSQLALGNNTDDADNTAPERFGMSFVDCGPDDIEEDGGERDGPDDTGIADPKGAALLAFSRGGCLA